MTLIEYIKKTTDLENSLVGLEIENTPRPRIAYACYSIAREHHASILILLQQESPKYATAFALLRPVLEATLRGEWISVCATEKQIRNFVFGGQRQLDMSSLVQALQKKAATNSMHQVLYQNLWPIVSSYTHTYEHQVRHWISVDGPIPNYEENQVQWLLNATTACLSLCVSSTHKLKINK